MGNKSSKSVNISTPKGDTTVDENNHVGNGDSGKPDGTRIIEDAKEQVKDLMKDIANEAVKKTEEVTGDVGKDVAKDKESVEKSAIEIKGEDGEQPATTPKEDKKKVQKKRSFRRFSFLRKEKKAKEEKPKQNGNVEAKDEKENAEENAGKEENGSAPVDADKLEAETAVKIEAVITEAAKPVETETESSEVKDIKVDDKVVEQVDETVTSYPETKVEEVLEVQEVAEENSHDLTEKVDCLSETLSKLEVKDVEKEMAESVEDKPIEFIKPLKEPIEEFATESITNGVSQTNGHEVAVE